MRVAALTAALLLALPAYAQDAQPPTKAEPAAKAPAADPAPATQPAANTDTPTPKAEPEKPAPLPDAGKPPETLEEGLGTAKDLIGAIKAKAWWLVAALGIFIVMLILKLVGVFKKIGKRATWWTVGGLSIVTGLLFAFDASGFSWSTFTGFLTAGPTVAWLRDWIKKGVFGKGETTPLKPAEDKPAGDGG